MLMTTRVGRLVVVALCGAMCFAARVGAGGTDKTTFKMSVEEKELLDLTNQERKKADRKPLKPSPVLFKVARAHSANMAKQGKMAHVLDGKNPFQRLKAAGYPYYRAGENVGVGNVPLKGVMKGWMDSKLHRENILNPEFTEIGLGRVVDANGDAYYTQAFGRPRSP
jgi:uncharacterized protein YkwD